MKPIVYAALVLFLTFGFLGTASAGSCRIYTGYSAPHKVSTCVVGRQCFARSFTDRCGRVIRKTYVRITYRDIYSNGTSRYWSRTIGG